MSGWKSRLAATGAGLGAARLLHVWRRPPHSPGRGFILFYHRVTDEPNRLELAVSPRRFAGQMEVLARRARVVPLSQLAERLRGKAPLEENLAAITFDDGYRDNLEIAAPILERLGLPATVFVATDFIDRRSVPFWDRIEHALERVWAEGIGEDDWPETGDPELDTLARWALGEVDRSESVARTCDAATRLDEPRRAALLAGFGELVPALDPSSSLMMDWDDVRTLHRRGFEIGSHTVSHPWLPDLDEAELERELGQSAQRITDELGATPEGFAYPWGRHAPGQPERVAEAGYRWAVTVEPGAARLGDDPLRLPRVMAGLGPPGVLDLKLALA